MIQPILNPEVITQRTQEILDVFEKYEYQFIDLEEIKTGTALVRTITLEGEVTGIEIVSAIQNQLKVSKTIFIPLSKTNEGIVVTTKPRDITNVGFNTVVDTNDPLYLAILQALNLQKTFGNNEDISGKIASAIVMSRPSTKDFASISFIELLLKLIKELDE